MSHRHSLALGSLASRCEYPPPWAGAYYTQQARGLPLMPRPFSLSPVHARGQRHFHESGFIALISRAEDACADHEYEAATIAIPLDSIMSQLRRHRPFAAEVLIAIVTLSPRFAPLRCRRIAFRHHFQLIGHFFQAARVSWLATPTPSPGRRIVITANAVRCRIRFPYAAQDVDGDGTRRQRVISMNSQQRGEQLDEPPPSRGRRLSNTK